MLKNIFLDLDDTILDFTAGEAKALSQTLREAGIEPTEAILDRYHIINTAHWELLEEGRLTRDEVLVQRFEQLFRELGVDHSGKAISERYEVLLSCQHDFMPGAEQLLKDLSSRYDLYLASNGAAAVQNPRLDDAGLRPYFKGIFISEEMGADKPSKAFFDACFAAIPGFRLEETVMVGDSLTSDIRGGSNTGLRTVWFNPHGKEPRPDIRPSYTIHALSELLPLLASTQ
ncbi:YjjG family noncanonical pyrimidine nucleotidase [Dysosmobacter sp.]|jgi:HAD hydrolase, TIGR02254 family|uniref:YjjG family noncanonical pyrimidine nucleotidase n=1 Tax=Dysosmobacter sp. TaxID=2591382 RepID=UPI003AEF9A2C